MHGFGLPHTQSTVRFFGVCIPRYRNMLVAEAFLGSLVKLYGKHIVCSDGRTWCPETCSSLGLRRILHFTPCLKRA